MRVGEVDAGSRDADQHLARAGARARQLGELEHLRAAELAHQDGTHRARRLSCPAAMAVTVVGSIAFDSVKTPFGERERMLGGAAVHFALAASFFDEVRVVGPVGDDFGEAELDVLRGRGVDVSDIEHVAGGETFFWAGEYGWDLNSRETLETRLGVFEHFEPKLSPAARDSEVLFLANIQPDVQRAVREQCTGARFAALDSMNLWIEIARDSLVQTIGGVDCLVLNDAELRQLTSKPNLIARRPRGALVGPPGPTVDDRQAGRVRRGADHRRRLLLAAGVPARDRRRPDRRRRHVRRRLRRLHRRPRGRRPARRARCCAARWPTAPRSRPSTSRSSAPSASPG